MWDICIYIFFLSYEKGKKKIFFEKCSFHRDNKIKKCGGCAFTLNVCIVTGNLYTKHINNALFFFCTNVKRSK